MQDNQLICLLPKPIPWDITALHVCRMIRLIRLLRKMFIMSMHSSRLQLPFIPFHIPAWGNYGLQLFYLVAVFINFLGCVWWVDALWL